MILPRFDYHAPTSLSEACQVLRHYDGRARILAGGTDLLVNMKKRVIAPPVLVGLDRIPDLDGVATRRGEVTIGARMTAAAIAASSPLRKRAEVLTQGAGRLGSPLIRNRATIGGNLANARPAADMAPPLLALGARVILADSEGQRETSLEEFFLGPGETCIRKQEILTAVVIPVSGDGTGGAYIKLGLRRTLEIAMVNVAAVITLSSNGKTIKAARVALGAVAPTPMRAVQAEAALIGASAGEKTFRRAGQAAAQDARPITDHRASAEYRAMMVDVLTRRALAAAFDAARRQ